MGPRAVPARPGALRERPGRHAELGLLHGRLMTRTITLAGCLSFRDLGGYPTADGEMVRWRQVFRSDALHRLTAEDVAHLRDVIGLHDVIDLRSSAELEIDGRGPLGVQAMRFHHYPLFDNDAPMSFG